VIREPFILASRLIAYYSVDWPGGPL
jgi:hypothetical protein